MTPIDTTTIASMTMAADAASPPPDRPSAAPEAPATPLPGAVPTVRSTAADAIFRPSERGAVRTSSPLDRRRATSWVEIDLGRLADNVTALRKLVGPRTGIAAVIKADAYGLGAAPVGRVLEGMGVERLAVYTPAQARELREAGIRAHLLVLMPARGAEILEMLADAPGGGLARIAFTAHDEQHAAELESVADRAGRLVPVHVEVDTGMSRGGVSPKKAPDALSRIAVSPRLRLEGLFTHFATADDPASPLFDEQLESFLRLLDRVQHLVPADCLTHAANSAAAFRSRRSHLRMIRPGVALIGYTGLESCWDDGSRGSTADGALVAGHAADGSPVLLRPIPRWMSRVAHVKWIAPGAPVGYGETWRAPRPTRVGLVPVGYADGYPCTLSNRGLVRLRVRSAGVARAAVGGGYPGFGGPRPVGAPDVSTTAMPPQAESEGPRMARAWFDAEASRLLSARQESGSTWVEVPVIGRVSMDQITIDLTDLPQEAGQVGAEVELFSDDVLAGNRLDRLARLADLPPYALLCGLSARIPRLYRLEMR